MSCGSLPALSDEVLRPVARLLDADSAVYMRFRQDPGGQPFICESAYTGPHPESLDAYVSGFYVEDPLIRPLIDQTGVSSASRSPIKFQLLNQVRQGALRRSNYFRNFLKPQELGDIIGVALPFYSDGPQLLCLGVHRHAGRPVFEKSQCLALDKVMRPIRLVLETLCMQSALAEQSAILKEVEASNPGVEYAALDESLGILRSSARMRAMLTANYSDPQALAGIRSGMRTLNGRVPDTRSSVEVLLPDGQPAKLSSAVGCNRRTYILVPSDVDRRPLPCLLAEGMQPGDKLTVREQQVIDQLATGGSNARIAEVLSISVRTVENHLRSIYEKLGINSRTQLISLLFSQ
jgi:DNA-binding CsgD family transcriptional regulator